MDLDHHRGGSGEPLVLIHGIGHTWRGWKPMLPLLERDFDVRIALELARRGRATSVVAISPAGLQHKRRPHPLRGPGGRAALAVDPEDFGEVFHLFADAPGFHATLRHTFEGQPKGLDAIDVPVLVLWGTLDFLLLPRQARRFERLIPNCELRYLSGLGHTPMSDDPELLAGEIRRWRAQRAEAPA
jgi:pimeloyl-ACP methyl ester carboxylesterase